MFDYKIEPYELEFIKPVKTSRQVFDKKTIWILKIWDVNNPNIIGIGEAAPIELLSPDWDLNFITIADRLIQEWKNNNSIHHINFSQYPSIIFALETALLDLQHKSSKNQVLNPFNKGIPIPINGLVWMSDINSMYQEALDKIKNGYKTIKFKVGALDFDEECKMLEKIRKQYSAFKIELRLDANGAFNYDDALLQLKDLSRFEIHSIEQPIKAGQWENMAQLCHESKIPIALDEELIGIDVFNVGYSLLNTIKPQYIILKPSLHGGIISCNEWIRLSIQNKITWWSTSALESNIALNSIATWVSEKQNGLAQGLGTGLLYKNNFDLGLKINNGFLYKTQ